MSMLPFLSRSYLHLSEYIHSFTLGSGRFLHQVVTESQPCLFPVYFPFLNLLSGPTLGSPQKDISLKVTDDFCIFDHLTKYAHSAQMHDEL